MAPRVESAPGRGGGAGREEEREPEPLVDPEVVAGVLPMAGMMAMGMLPMIASALAGLGGGGDGGGSAPVASGVGSDGSGAVAGGMSPEAARAMDVLKQLEGVYGEGEPVDPQARELPQQSGGVSGSGATTRAIRAKRLFQRNAAKAFNNVDNQLVSYVQGLKGSNKVDKKAIIKLVREVNVALAELGPQAYTKAGQQKVHQILTAALLKAQSIVSGGSATSSDTAAAINRLTKQYLYNIAGKNYTPPTGTNGSTGATGAAAKAIQVALAQLGDPYVYGAEGPNAFDCSGLMQYAAAAAGVRIPRVAADQYRTLPKVNPRDIKPGDLIFPSSSFKGPNNPGHVIMYIGNGMCVEAPRTGGHVQYRKLPSSYAAARWA
ncbi:hypothetical protein IFM12276_49360 [Nocardia sputorum]|uniref:NlpC/P60 domain-containing protein n=1 Tax=Nocardia sputorum TaxID=2984338 RepID=A0ABM8D3E5_9NOCA|nr:hypothetical protein IFM12276_49360 [Nocardia sputorum]